MSPCVRRVSVRSLIAALGAVLLVLEPLHAQAPAQTVPSGPLTLEQVLQLAEARSETLAAARAGITRADADAARARSGRFPQLSASVTYDRALASEFEGLFGDTGLDGDGGQAFEDLPFGRENTWRLNLSFSQNLFSGGRLGAAQALAAGGRTIAGIGLDTARAQLLLDVTQAYYDAALSERLVSISEATLKQATETVVQVNTAFNAGTQPEFELLRARVTRDTQLPALIRQRANRDIALLRLKQFLDLPVDFALRLDAGLDVATPPEVFAAQVADLERTADAQRDAAALLEGPPLEDRAPVREAAATLQLREAALYGARAERMPTMSLNSNYGRVGYPAGALPELGRTNWTIGVALNVPILTGGRIEAEARGAAADLEASRAQLQRVEELAQVDTQAAYAELMAARSTWNTTAGTVEQAIRAHEIAQVRYREGVSTQLELSDARLLLQQAEANRAQAARDLQVARARVALLPQLPLGTIGGQAPRIVPQAPVFSTPSPSVPTSSGGSQLRNAGGSGQGTRAFTQAGGQQ